MEQRERGPADAEARTDEQREWETRLFLTMATLRHRHDDITLANQDMVGGVPVGRLRFLVDVDALTFWNTYNELRRRRGWR